MVDHPSWAGGPTLKVTQALVGDFCTRGTLDDIPTEAVRKNEYLMGIPPYPLWFRPGFGSELGAAGHGFIRVTPGFM